MSAYDPKRTSAIISRRDNEPGSVADFGTAKDLFPQIAKHAGKFDQDQRNFRD
jgi:hypothetical protein